MPTKSKINNGTITLINNEKGSHLTLTIKTVKKEGNFQGKRIISRLVGRDNTRDYEGFGFVNNNDTISLWTKHRNAKNAQIAHIVRSLFVEGNASKFAKTVSMEVSKRCMRCNSKLTTPQSLEDGIGPVCIKKGMTF
jgi:hypothetical protein